MNGVIISSAALLGIGYAKHGGVVSFKERLWTRVAFAARYGHQNVRDLLQMERGQLESFNDALAGLLRDENKNGSNFTETMMNGG